MGRLVYASLTSLDGFVADPDGRFDWAVPDAKVHAFVNDLQAGVGTHLYGRRLFEVMRAWDEPLADDASPEEHAFAARWRDADKVVFSRTLEEVATARTTLVHDFDPDAVRRLVEGADHDVLVGGPTLAAEALRAGLVDEVHQLISPVVVGGGTPYLPDGLHLELRLQGSRSFANGVVHVGYEVVR